MSVKKKKNTIGIKNNVKENHKKDKMILCMDGHRGKSKSQFNKTAF